MRTVSMIAALAALALSISFNLDQALIAPDLVQSSSNSPLALDSSLATMNLIRPTILDVTESFLGQNQQMLQVKGLAHNMSLNLVPRGYVPFSDDLIYELNQRYPILCGTSPDIMVLPDKDVIIDERNLQPWVKPQPFDPEFEYPTFQLDKDDDAKIHPLFELDRDRPRFVFPNVC